MLDCQNLSAGYGAAGRPVLSDLSQQFAPGEFTALIGPNGSAKSTLLKAIMGLLPQQSGQVRLMGEDLNALPRKLRAKRISYLPQSSSCPDYISVRELVSLGGYARHRLFEAPSNAHKRRCLEALETVGLRGQADAQVNALSGGQRQRAWIAMILVQSTKAILLDEPVNHLDLRYQIAVLDLVQRIAHEQNRIVVCVLHDLNLAARYANRVVLMDRGEIVARGAVRDALRPEILRRAYGVDVDVFTRNGRLICAAEGLAQ